MRLFFLIVSKLNVYQVPASFSCHFHSKTTFLFTFSNGSTFIYHLILLTTLYDTIFWTETQWLRHGKYLVQQIGKQTFIDDDICLSLLLSFIYGLNIRCESGEGWGDVYNQLLEMTIQDAAKQPGRSALPDSTTEQIIPPPTTLILQPFYKLSFYRLGKCEAGDEGRTEMM